MSIVKYRDGRTGRVSVYESTPHCDPETKQNRPTRRYLGTLDPETGELRPSSGRPGRRPGSGSAPAARKAAPEPPSPAADDVARSLAGAEEQRDGLARRVRELERQLGECRDALRRIAEVAGAAGAGA